MLDKTQKPLTGSKHASYTSGHGGMQLSFAVWGIAIAFSCAQAVSAEQPMRVRESFTGPNNALERNFKSEVIQLLLEKSRAKYGAYRIEVINGSTMTQGRVFRELQAGHVDVTTSMTDESREQMAIPIRYCLYKGLLGVRIGMGTQATVDKLEHIQSREELNRIPLGLVFDWPDYSIQKDAGLAVERLQDFDSGVFRLQKETLSLMPLGVVEVAPIARKRGLATISSWAIAYPTAYYIFVSKTRPELAERLQFGFEVALKDHSFDALFAKHIGTQLASAGLEKRRMFHIPNPYLPKATPLERRELWHPLVLQKLQ